jgi:tetratricopeptide (TPR) repeat protein
MTEWFRNADWSPEIEAEFEARIARSRAQKAQHLRIQGSLLKDSHPEVAIRLLARCVELDDPFQVAPAWLDMAHAHWRLGDLDRALASLEAAMEQQQREPMVRTSAAFDYAMLVALHMRRERFDRAVAVLQSSAALFPAMEFQREAALAIIHRAQGRMDDARAAAERALQAEAAQEGWIPGFPDVGIVPNTTNPLSAGIREVLAAPRR